MDAWYTADGGKKGLYKSCYSSVNDFKEGDAND
jgi:hypothetical protein